MIQEEHKRLPEILFGCHERAIWMESLFGLSCTQEGPQRARGWFSLETTTGPIFADEFRLLTCKSASNELRAEWTTPQGLRLESVWTFDDLNGVWSRRDSLHNESSQAITIMRFLSRFTFQPDTYELYSQTGQWCRENQGHWRELDHGQVILTCKGGRTTQGCTPFVAIRRRDGGEGLAIHMLPMGNWEFRVTNHTNMNGRPYLTLDAGMATEHFHLSLKAGESFKSPVLLLHTLIEGRIESNTAAMHAHAMEFVLPSNRDIPVVYNTWFDMFDILDMNRLRRQLAVAKQVGCEVFVVDAGWYGQCDGDWFHQCGDWREKTDKAFHGRMKDFADEVRAAGLGFGLWMEPERFCTGVPAVIEHPDWFLRSESGNYYPNLEIPAAMNYLRDEIVRLVETYGLAWMKVDFNHMIGPDASEKTLNGYYRAWYALLDEVQHEHPDTIFEGCASGGMRMDLNTLKHFDLHFLSDSVDPVDVLRIRQGALLRTPPGCMGTWLTLRSIGQTLPLYCPEGTQSDRVASPCGATWDFASVVDIDFAARTALCGILGLSGDLAGLAELHRERVAYHVRFFKAWRKFIATSVAYLLTPPRPIDDRSGWAAIQLQSRCGDTSLVFVYRLNDRNTRRRFPLKGLAGEKTYRVKNVDSPQVEREIRGAFLQSDGLEVVLAAPNTAAVFEIVSA